MMKKGLKLLPVVVLLVLAGLMVPNPVYASPTAYYPSAYNLIGATTYKSGAIGDLVSDNAAYMVFGGYSTQSSTYTLYAHSETTTIGGTSYYWLKTISGDTAGATITVSGGTAGLIPVGKFVYQLTDIPYIMASTWSVRYRTYVSTTDLVGHCEVDILVRRSDGVIRTTIATGVASTGTVTATSWTTMSATYSFTGYTVVDQTDYLEVDYIFHITTKKAGSSAYFRIDDSTVASVSQTGVSSVTFAIAEYALYAQSEEIMIGGVSYYLQKTTVSDGPNSTLTVDGGTTGLKWFGNFTYQLTDIPKISARTWTVYYRTRVFNSSIAGHCEIDIKIRMSNGTVRTTIATGVASTGTVTATSWTIMSATYSFTGYTVVDQTDYLEIDYKFDVTTAKPNTWAYLNIDNNLVTTGLQTRVTPVAFPAQFKAEVQFQGTSDTNAWGYLVWTYDSCWTAASIKVTLQLWDYQTGPPSGTYPESGDGYIYYISSTTPSTDETKNQAIGDNPTRFKNATTTAWKTKIKGTALTPFDLKVDLVKYDVTVPSTASVYIYPVSQSVTVAFNISVRISGVTDLYGWEFQISYNKTALTATKVYFGPFLNKSWGSANTFGSVIQLNDTAGLVWATQTIYGDNAGASGSGILANVTFSPDIHDGSTTSLDLHDTQLIGYQFTYKIVYIIPRTETDATVTLSLVVPEFPFGATLEIALIPTLIYLLWKKKKNAHRALISKTW